MSVDDGLEDSADDSGPSFPECPTCGDEIVATAVAGPTDGTAVPCGCRVIPPVLEFEE